MGEGAAVMGPLSNSYDNDQTPLLASASAF